jgi:hypothetical protein
MLLRGEHLTEKWIFTFILMQTWNSFLTQKSSFEDILRAAMWRHVGRFLTLITVCLNAQPTLAYRWTCFRLFWRTTFRHPCSCRGRSQMCPCVYTSLVGFLDFSATLVKFLVCVQNVDWFVDVYRSPITFWRFRKNLLFWENLKISWKPVWLWRFTFRLNAPPKGAFNRNTVELGVCGLL